MKRIKLLGCIILATTLCCVGNVKSTDIKFDSKHIQLGNLYLEDGITSLSYTFTNQSSSPFIIYSVEGACGCTNAKASKDTFAPGESGTISAQFNPKGFSGSVKKWVYVRGNFSDKYRIDLDFEASILTKNLAVQTYYGGRNGYLFLDKDYFGWGSKYVGEKYQDSITLKNNGYHPITIKSLQKAPPFISTDMLPLTIDTGASKVLYLTIDLSQIDTVGLYSGDMRLYTSDHQQKIKEIGYWLDFKQDFRHLKKRHLKKAPRILITPPSINMGKMHSGGIKKKTIYISNSGKQDLKILRIISDCSCTLIEPTKRILAPQEKMTVEVTFDALYKSGRQHKSVRIYTNDPITPIKTFSLKAEIVKN